MSNATYNSNESNRQRICNHELIWIQLNTKLTLLYCATPLHAIPISSFTCIYHASKEKDEDIRNDSTLCKR